VSDDQTLPGFDVDQCGVPFNLLCSFALEAPVQRSAINPSLHIFEQEFPPRPPVTQSCLVPPVYTPNYHTFRQEEHYTPDRSHPYVPRRTQSGLTGFRCVPPTASSASPLKPTVASDAIKKASMKRRKRRANFVCETCGADFTAQHNLKSKFLPSACVRSY
jgi:hypothetical protein